MDNQHFVPIAAACGQLAQTFAYGVDRGDIESVVALFTADATFERRGEVLHGQDQIRAALNQRSRSVLTRHLCSPCCVEVLSPDQARGITYFQFHRHEWPAGAPAEGEVAPLGAAQAIGEYHDEFVRTADGWRIRMRVARTVLRQAA